MRYRHLVALAALTAACVAPRARAGDGPLAGSSRPKPRVEVLANGAEPRRRLRYVPKAGDTFDVVHEVRRTMSGSVAGMPVPVAEPLHITIAVTVRVREVREGGDVAWSLRVRQGDASSLVVEGQSSDVAAELYELLEDAEVGIVRSARGVLVSVENPLKEELPTRLAWMADVLGGFGEDAAPVLPEEEVGVGARWAVVRDDVPLFSGVHVSTRDVYALVAVEGDVLTLTCSGALSATDQEMGESALVAGMKIESLVHEVAEHTIRVDLGVGIEDRPEATRSRMKAVSSVEIGGVRRVATVESEGGMRTTVRRAAPPSGQPSPK